MAVVSFSLKSADLSGLDELDTESIALFCWSDVRPLSGAAGFLDWRLCGALSRTLVNEQFVGDLNESMLMPINSRLSLKRVFVFGLGSSKDYSAAVVKEACTKAFTSLIQAGVKSVCVGLPSHRRHPDKSVEFHNILVSDWADSIDLVLAEPSVLKQLT